MEHKLTQGTATMIHHLLWLPNRTIWMSLRYWLLQVKRPTKSSPVKWLTCILTLWCLVKNRASQLRFYGENVFPCYVSNWKTLFETYHTTKISLQTFFVMACQVSLTAQALNIWRIVYAIWKFPYCFLQSWSTVIDCYFAWIQEQISISKTRMVWQHWIGPQPLATRP